MISITHRDDECHEISSKTKMQGVVLVIVIYFVWERPLSGLCVLKGCFVRGGKPIFHFSNKQKRNPTFIIVCIAKGVSMFGVQRFISEEKSQNFDNNLKKKGVGKTAVLLILTFTLTTFLHAYSLTQNSWVQQEKLMAGDPDPFHLFGSSVAVSGKTAVFGAIFDDDDEVFSGAAYVFIHNGDSWSQQAKLKADDPEASDLFGRSVAISGDTIVVGAFQDDDNGDSSGAAYVFVRSGSSWSQQAKLTPSHSAAGDQFGYSVAISGDTVVIGAIGDEDNGRSSGAAYVFVRSGGNWSQQEKLTASDAAAVDIFGNSVAVSEDTIVIGAPGDDDGGTSSGSAYVFMRSAGNWNQQAKLTASDVARGDEFGWSVSASEDKVIIGAHFDDSGGAAYVFVRDGSSWRQQQKLSANDEASGDDFGYSVTLLEDIAVIGAIDNDDKGEESGSAYVFVLNGSNWIEQAKLTANDGAADDQFGWSVAVSGDMVVIGTPRDDDNIGTDSGSVYMFPFTQISINDVSLAEGGTGATTLSFTVTRTNNYETVSVHYATADGTATTVDGDYTATSGIINFAAGDPLIQQVAIQVNEITG